MKMSKTNKTLDIEKEIEKGSKWNKIACVGYIIGICICLVSLMIHILSIRYIQDKLDTHIANDTIDCHSDMIKINGIWIDEDDYNQMDWKSYTDTIQP